MRCHLHLATHRPRMILCPDNARAAVSSQCSPDPYFNQRQHAVCKLSHHAPRIEHSLDVDAVEPLLDGLKGLRGDGINPHHLGTEAPTCTWSKHQRGVEMLSIRWRHGWIVASGA